jgi:hypothetical protein
MELLQYKIPGVVFNKKNRSAVRTVYVTNKKTIAGINSLERWRKPGWFA